jgi:hypothetical protein
MENIINHKTLLKNVKNKNNLSVTLKKTEDKGVGLLATKTIRKGELIAYYKVKVFKHKKYDSPTNCVYIFEVYRKNGEVYKTLMGDIDEESFPEPLDNITFWAPFANEPSKNQRTNAEIDINLSENYADRKFAVEGDTMIYKLIASKMIRKGEEILWYYGEGYARDYTVGRR